MTTVLAQLSVHRWLAPLTVVLLVLLVPLYRHWPAAPLPPDWVIRPMSSLLLAGVAFAVVYRFITGIRLSLRYAKESANDPA